LTTAQQTRLNISRSLKQAELQRPKTQTKRNSIMDMTRRTAVASAVGLLISTVMARSAESVHWSYEGSEGPEFWGELTDEFRICSFGSQQSPIDLAGAFESDLATLDLNWNAAADWQVVNNGHTIQANPGDGGYAIIEGKRYALLQFHFHAPSEHAIDGKRFDMEAHFVHKAEDGALAVVGVMLTGGGQNDLFESVMNTAPREKGEAALGTGDPARLMPDSGAVLRYQGSLTTPPCSETVLWTIMTQPLQVSDAAIAAFTSIYDANARPLQDVNRRFILSEG
jgi:carbonic anhydrase